MRKRETSPKKSVSFGVTSVLGESTVSLESKNDQQVGWNDTKRAKGLSLPSVFQPLLSERSPRAKRKAKKPTKLKFCIKLSRGNATVV
eukprot:1371533-Amorphochlora_amoeboformis.AAC.2